MPVVVDTDASLRRELRLFANHLGGTYLLAQAGAQQVLQHVQRGGRESLALYEGGTVTFAVGSFSRSEVEENLRLAGYQWLVLFFSRWECTFRPRFVSVLGGDPKRQTVQCDLFGDMRLLRHVVLHEDARCPPGLAGRLQRLAARVVDEQLLVIDQDKIRVFEAELGNAVFRLAPRQVTRGACRCTCGACTAAHRAR